MKRSVRSYRQRVSARGARDRVKTLRHSPLQTLAIKLATADSPSTSLSRVVYIEAEVAGPGPKANFEPDSKANPPEAMTSAFAKCMEGQANVLLLSGPAGSGKSTAYIRLQTWVLSDYARMKKKEEVSSAGFLIEPHSYSTRIKTCKFCFIPGTRLIPSTPLTVHVCLTKTASNQPHLLSRPVTVPFSCPRLAR